MPSAERALIARIRARSAASRSLVAGIGDDCAVLRLPKGHEFLVTTDFSLEGVHFRREWHSPAVVGHRCLTRGLSDIAAMGGEPLAVFLSLALPAKLPQRWVDGFFDGLLALAKSFGAPLAGGDTAQSTGGVLADILVLGSVPRGTAILRSGARPGDSLYVTGELGAGAAALEPMLRTGRKVSAKSYPRHFHPTPRIAVGQFLRKHALASSMIDLSDGLSTDLSHLCEESHVGAELHADLVPHARIGKTRRFVDRRFALHGGDDYELLFTARPTKKIPERIAGIPVTPIGRITRGPGMKLVENGRTSQLHPQGWEHFAAENA
jgi:thiamine-monophosphate kinase